MGVLSFTKEAGEKLIGIGSAKAKAKAERDRTAAATIVSHFQANGLDASALTVELDEDSGAVTLTGLAPDQATKEKVLLCAYPSVFKANKPMLSPPDKIYPGQMLRTLPL